MKPCLSCASLNLRKVTRQQVAAQHVYCDKLEAVRVLWISDSCQEHVPVADDVTSKRVAWIKQLK